MTSPLSLSTSTSLPRLRRFGALARTRVLHGLPPSTHPQPAMPRSAARAGSGYPSGADAMVAGKCPPASGAEVLTGGAAGGTTPSSAQPAVPA